MRHPPPPEPSAQEWVERFLPPVTPVLPDPVVRRRRQGNRIVITWRNGLRRYLDPFRK